MILIWLIWALVDLFSPDACPLTESWKDEWLFIDQGRYLDFDADGSGLMVFVDNQAFLSEEFWYRRKGDNALEISVAQTTRTIGYRIDRGNFVVRDPQPDESSKPIHYRCRITFEKDPFPKSMRGSDVRVYYSCPAK